MFTRQGIAIMKSVSCFHCGQVYSFTDKILRRETCPQCGSDLHCCQNCTFYDTRAPKECREPVAEYVRYKDRANHCDYFEPRPAGDKTADKQKDAGEAARKAWENLFKK